MNPNVEFSPYGIKVIAVGLSDNASAPIVDDAQGIEGKLNEGTDGRRYFMIHFKDPKNPFSPMRSRVIAQNYRNSEEKTGAHWRAITPKEALSLVGSTISAGRFFNAQTEPYEVNGRTVYTFSGVLFMHENLQSFLGSRNPKVYLRGESTPGSPIPAETRLANAMIENQEEEDLLGQRQQA